MIAKKAGLKLVLESDISPVITPEANVMNEKIQDDEFYQKVYNKVPNEHIDSNHLDIAFIVPDPIKGSGGHRNIYRAVKFLKNSGHDLTVYYINTKLNARTVKKQVTDWFYDMLDIPFICYDGTLG